MKFGSDFYNLSLILSSLIMTLSYDVNRVKGVMTKSSIAVSNVSKIHTKSSKNTEGGLLDDIKKRRHPHSPCRQKSCRVGENSESESILEIPSENQWSSIYNVLGNKSFSVNKNEFEGEESDEKNAVSEATTTTTYFDNESKEDGIVKPRLIAVKIPAFPPRSDLKNVTNPVQSIYGKYPTIRLADFARKIIFPEWIWTRLANPPTVKKSETLDVSGTSEVPLARPADLIGFNDTFFPTTTTRRPKGILERPTITFDNNMSRFLRLFTVVRFQNVPCLGPSGENGTCYHGRECSDLGGHSTTPCAQGLGVCCIFFKSCGETIYRNGTYFVSAGASFTRGVSTCNVNIQKLTPTIRQIRLDFHTFIMQPPNAGNCESDRFLVSGQNTNNIIPILCGNNSGSHLYIEAGTSHSLVQLSVMTTGEGLRAWTIQVNQIEEITSIHSAPSHCLQYLEGTMGTITSFNYDSTLSPQYLNNLNYAICIRKEAGFCSITYSNMVPDGQYYPFQIVNADAQGNLLLPSGQAGIGFRNCPDDYIQFSGIRLCGERLNDASKTSLMMDDSPVTDATNGPFMVLVRTNEIDVGGGFSLYYRQNPCMSTAG